MIINTTVSAIKLSNAKEVVEILKKHKKVALFLGPNIDEETIEFAKKLKNLGINLFVSCSSSKFFNDLACTSLVKATHEIKEKKEFGLIIFIGIKRFFSAKLISILKPSGIKTIDLSGKYQEHADYSFPDLGERERKKMLEEILKIMGAKT